ncbi:transcriptional regulator [Renibacterium salmoninarum ATCC 33209]|uniref:Transcriptional regulator n=1 Tax=Renibacterium salmoninarum (strain ATCC 33209 / DSM 20767 / JCM 11484 / NBRC 15589 / NCIMB 2235) TaxID=288705 RepID=A9WVM5_RENSM|nr:LacI family DNA-binding transcriptional regulator [Renibacterium salmoninarum]ABY25246.1 transcriptional regulator [Renibacterium salmoninarum ATCC 33209]
MIKSVPTRATMKDVAARAGVGLATVLRVVNGDANVSNRTKVLVDQAIAELGFRRNDSARLLRQGIAASIGVVLDDVADPFFAMLNRAVEAKAIERHVLAMTVSTGNDAEQARELINALCARRVDGLIVAAPRGTDESYLRHEIQAGTPVVFVDRPPVDLATDAVLSDNLGGARNGVDHLIAQGHSRIACLSDGSDLYSVHQRVQGYWQALANANIAAEAKL